MCIASAQSAHTTGLGTALIGFATPNIQSASALGNVYCRGLVRKRAEGI